MLAPPRDDLRCAAGVHSAQSQVGGAVVDLTITYKYGRMEVRLWRK